MRRWHSLLEIVQFPLKMLFLAVVLLGISGLILNPSAAVFWTVDNTIIIRIAEILKYFGSFLITNFPFFVLIKLLARRYDSSTPIFVGVAGYIIFNVVTMFMANTNLPAAAYSSILGLSLNAAKIQGMTAGIHYPLQTGFIAVFIVNLATRYAYNRSRSHSPYSLFSFIDRDTWSLLTALVLSGIGGLLTALIWPAVIAGFYVIFRFISNDITNPMNLFVYGVMDRLMNVLNLGGLLRNPFWFGDMGGTWIDFMGINYAGDVAVWTAQQARNIASLGTGRLITPYYILNLFAVPGMIVAFYTVFTDKIEKHKYRLFLVLAIFLSLISGTLLPLEIMLLLVAPLLFAFHLIYTGALFAILQAMSVSLGYSYSGSLAAATPGNLLDLLLNVRNPNLSQNIMIICAIGVVSALIYFLVTRYYFRHLAIDLFNTGITKRKVEGFILAVGGVENIRMIQSSINKLTIQLHDASLMNFNQLQRLGASKVTETRAGYSITLGSGSTIIKNEVNKRIKDQKR